MRGPENDRAERSPSDNSEPTKGSPAPKSLAATVPDRHEDDDGEWAREQLAAAAPGG